MMRSIPLVVAVLSALPLGLASRSSRAETPSANATPIYILTLWTEDVDDQADALTRALRTHVRQTPAWALVETNQSFETLSIALKCPPKPDATCLQRMGDQLKAVHFLWGTLERRKGASAEVTADLHLWTRGKPSTEARGVFADGLKDPNDEALQAIAGDLFTQVAGTTSQNAPGSTSAPGAVSGGSNQGTPAVNPVGGGEGGSSTAITTAPEEPASRFSARAALGYSTLAVGVGFVAGAAVEAANWVGDSNANADDRKSVPATVTNVCNEQNNAAALDACNKSSDAARASTLGWIFAGAGTALVTTGLWLVLTDHPGRRATTDDAATASRPKVDVVPSLGLRSGSVGVRLTY